MIYLDYQATTPLAPEALEAMLPWLRDQHANPHSAHASGRAAKAAVEVARGQVLRLIAPEPQPAPLILDGLHPSTQAFLEDIERQIAARREHGPGAGQVFFTSGATEALNWAITGTWERLRAERPKIVTIATEHAAVLDTVDALRLLGAELVILPVDRDGFVDLDAAKAAIDTRTALVCAMLINNEIGVRQHVDTLGALAHEHGAVVLCDAVQGVGRWGVPLWACDLVAISAHKIYGPKGIGALWVRNGYMPAPLLHGGGQEAGVRSGTLSPALCAGFGAAARLMRERVSEDMRHVEHLWRVARQTLKGPEWLLNGSRVQRYKGNLNVRRPGLDVARLMSDCRDIAFSAGSACASGSGRPSHVLRALGLTDAEARSSIRLGWGRYTTEDELRDALTRIDVAARAQRIAA